MRSVLLAVAVTGFSMLSCAARADTFNFSTSALGNSLSGVLTATQGTNGSYSVTGITGAGIIGLVAAGDPFFGNDNLLFPANARALDVNGLAFTLALGAVTYSVDIYSEVSGYKFLALDSSNTLTFDTASFALTNAATATPEPSSLLLLGTGLMGLGAVVRRRFV